MHRQWAEVALPILQVLDVPGEPACRRVQSQQSLIKLGLVTALGLHAKEDLEEPRVLLLLCLSGMTAFATR